MVDTASCELMKEKLEDYNSTLKRITNAKILENAKIFNEPWSAEHPRYAAGHPRYEDTIDTSLWPELGTELGTAWTATESDC